MKVIILPGLHGTDALHGDLIEALSQRGIEAVVVDYPNGEIKYSDLVNRVQAILPTTNFLLVAESFSGPIAIEIAAERPDWLKGVLFVATFAKPPRRLSSKLASVAGFIPLKWKLSSVLAQPLVMGKWANSRFTEQFHQVLSTLPEATIVGRLKQVLTVDKSRLIRRISVPFKYLAAQNDRLVPPGTAADFCIHDVQLRSVEGPHFLAQARPDLWQRSSLNLLESYKRLIEPLRISFACSGWFPPAWTNRPPSTGGPPDLRLHR